MALLKHPVVVGLAAWFASLVVLGMLIGPVRCSSGWQSPSIGMQGACSSHGGVNRVPQGLANIASIGIGIYAGLFVAGRRRGKNNDSRSVKPRRSWREDQRNAHKTSPSPMAEPTACGNCGGETLALSESGRIFLRCRQCGSERDYWQARPDR